MCVHLTNSQSYDLKINYKHANRSRPYTLFTNSKLINFKQEKMILICNVLKKFFKKKQSIIIPLLAFLNIWSKMAKTKHKKAVTVQKVSITF